MGQNAEYAYSYYIDQGYSPQAAAAIVGHFDHESGFNTQAIHDKGTGFGVAGWRDEKPGSGRKTKLMQFAQKNRLNPNSLGTQLEFADYELRTSEKAAGDKLRKAKTLDEANLAMMDYERPQGYSPKNPQAGHGYASRLAKAKSALASYAGIEATANPDDPELVDNTDTEAIPTNDMKWDDASLEDAANAAEEPGIGDRLKSGIRGLLKGMSSEDKPQEPFDYTPAGESNLQTEYDPNAGGLPLDNYHQYAGYAEGGNVDGDHIDPWEFFSMVIGDE